jgi:peptide/nickel transport system ATP-binding protein
MLLEIRDVTVEFSSMQDKITALSHISFSIDRGEIVGVVGESGSGKSVTALTILGLLDKNAKVASGQILYQGENVLTFDKKRRQADWHGISRADDCAAPDDEGRKSVGRGNQPSSPYP